LGTSNNLKGGIGIRNGFFSFAVLLVVAGLFIGGAQSQAEGLFPSPWDKLAHIAFFLALTILTDLGLVLPVWQLAALVLTVSVADEIHQLWLPGRTASLLDLLADGAGLGFALIFLKVNGRGRR
jgi:VanZ family protein